MKKLTVRELEHLLDAAPAGEPPLGLAEKIKAEIPETLPAPAPVLRFAPRRPAWHPHRWRLAAALLMVVGGGSLAWWTWREAPPLTEPAPAAAGGDLDLEAGENEVSSDLEGFADQAPARVDLAEGDEEKRIQQELRAESESTGTIASMRVAPPPPPASARPAAPRQRAAAGPSAQPVEIPEAVPGLSAEHEVESPLYVGEEFSVEGGVEGGVPGGVPGGVYGGIPGGTAGGVPGGVYGELSRAVAAPSTGGTDEPNDAAYGDVFFRHYGVNPFLDPEEDRLSTFALDADTGSWGVVGRYLDDGNLPPAEAVRVEEIVNALDYGDPPPAEDDFALYAEGAPTPFGGGDRYRLLRFAVKAREVHAADRKPAALTFVVDVSGSMAQENRLGLVQRSLGLLLDELRPDDRVGLVIYGDRGEVILRPTADKEAIRVALDRLVPEGSTNAEEGLALGYDVASEALRPGAINRVILASDGVANVGATGPDSILARVRAEAARGIELTTLGFGMGNYNDVLMERLADDGDGRYAYLDDLDEARRVLVEELTGTLQTVAEEARAQVEFDPEVVERYRLLGYENRDLADERFRDDTADAGEIGAGHTVTALYEVKLREQATGRAGRRAYRDAPAATLRLRWRPAGAEEFVERERPLLVGELAASWDAAPAALRLAGLAAELAELLRGSYWAREGSLDDVFRRLQRLQPELAGDERAAELAAMAGKAARLGGRKLDRTKESGGGR